MRVYIRRITTSIKTLRVRSAGCCGAFCFSFFFSSFFFSPFFLSFFFFLSLLLNFFACLFLLVSLRFVVIKIKLYNYESPFKEES